MQIQDLLAQISPNLRQMIVQEIANLSLKFRESTSSVKITQSSTGKPGVEIKVYNDDPVAAMNQTRYLYRWYRSEYHGEPYEDKPNVPPFEAGIEPPDSNAPPMESYENDAPPFAGGAPPEDEEESFN